jgi:hypothetical protein
MAVPEAMDWANEAKREAAMAEANKRAEYAKPLSALQAAEAHEKFLKLMHLIGSDVIHGQSAAEVRKFLVPYLGFPDACLLTQYIATGNRWSERHYGQQSTSEEDCCTGDFVNLGLLGNWQVLERSVEEAYEHAEIVFKNNRPVVNFLKSLGATREAKKKAHEGMRDRKAQEDALKALGKGLEWGGWIITALLVGGAAFWIYSATKATTPRKKAK